MDRFELYYKDTKIGTLYVKNERHKYVPEFDRIAELKEIVPFDPVVMKESDWREKIPFFQSRLESNKRFPNLEIGNLTDSYRLKKIEEKSLQ